MTIARLIICISLTCSFLINTADARAQRYTSRPDIQQFITMMVKSHHFDRSYLTALLDRARHQPHVIELMQRPAEHWPWHRYRPLFITDRNIREGKRFLREYRAQLAYAERKYGVPPEMITAIIGVETSFGRDIGRYRVLDALSTLAFYYPPRSAYFTRELEHFLLLIRETGIDPFTCVGSYAGAMGHPQFMPSSYRTYAIDMNRNGTRDLWNEPADIIGSVANYFQQHGWRTGEQVAALAPTPQHALQQLFNDKKLFIPTSREHPLYALFAELLPDCELHGLVRLETLPGPEYWVVYHNFLVIKRYNPSTHYAMAVFQLSQAIKAAK